MSKQDKRTEVEAEGESLASSPERFFNREVSWLGFNQRVISEAKNQRHPLLERVKFLAISASNLEEFYMVRVAGLVGQVQEHVEVRSPDGLSAEGQLAAVTSLAGELLQQQRSTWGELKDELRAQDIHVIQPDDLKEDERIWLSAYFEDEIMPVLTPISVDTAHPFPFVRNLGFGMALRLIRPRSKKPLNGLVLLPDQLPGFVRLPDSANGLRMIALRDVLDCNIEQLYPSFEIASRGYFHVIRDSDIEVAEEAEDLVRVFETALKRRQRGQVIHLSVDQSMSDDLRVFLMDEFELDPSNCATMQQLMRLTSLFQLASVDRPELKFEPFSARFPERIRDLDGDCFAAIKAKDFVVHHPFESFDVVVQFLRQAARDPNVLSIKQTLYRTSNRSPIVRALCDAAEAGKSVTALVELKARFDEAANIRWSRDLERAGVQVVYGFVEFKTHAKVSLITRREADGVASYVHFGTGNYHPATAKIYTDLSYFTTDEQLTRDANLLFNYMTSYVPPTGMKRLVAAPLNMRERLLEHIEAEIAAAKKGKSPVIWAKMNSLVDPNIIDAFYRASRAGVEIKLSVRGICCLRPGVPGLSENIEVRSIVGRYLEHSRIYCFSQGLAMKSETAAVYISSADLMPRNLDRRVETMVPIENETVKNQIVGQIMTANFKDNLNAWILQADGSYQRLEPKSEEDAFSSHTYCMTNPSLSGRGSALRRVKS